MKTELYNEIGGGRAKYPSGWMLNATWPFSRLILTEDGVQYKLLKKQINIRYSDIERIDISRLGYIWFVIKGEDTLYAFTGIGLNRVIDILKVNQVAIPQGELDKLGFAIGFVKGEIILAFGFFAVWLMGLLTGLTLILTHVLRQQ